MIKRALFVIAFGVALYLLIPRLGGLQHDLAALRHANISLMLLGVAAEAASLAAYVVLYRSLLRAEHAEVGFLAAGRGVMSAFLVSHLVPAGAAAGTVVNIRTMEREGVPARRTGLALAMCVVLSDMALAFLFLVGLVYSAIKTHLAAGYVAVLVVMIPLLVALFGLVFALAFHRDAAARIVRRVGRALHHISKRLDPDALARGAEELAAEARAALSGRRFLFAMSLALSNWVLDILVLYWFFLAVGHHQRFGGRHHTLRIAPYAVAALDCRESAGFASSATIQFRYKASGSRRK